jgi:RNA polymerase sigma-70 factor, ECF subfamily
MNGQNNPTKSLSMRTKRLNEREIVDQILAGNERALRTFYRFFAGSLHAYIYKKVNNPADSEEIHQDVLLSTLEGLRDFSFKSSLFTFMCAIANHKVIDFYRRKKIKEIVLSKIIDAEPLLSTLLGPEDALDRTLLSQRIHQTFQKITPIYKEILTLKYIYGYSVDEIARKLSITFKSAESQLFRARKAFSAEFIL